LQTFVALSLVWHAAVPGVCGLGLGLARGGLCGAVIPHAGADLAAENARLRRENERLRMEREILKKTLRIFSEAPR
jgi:transposase-like protein